MIPGRPKLPAEITIYCEINKIMTKLQNLNLMTPFLTHTHTHTHTYKHTHTHTHTHTQKDNELGTHSSFSQLGNFGDFANIVWNTCI